jgi:hypothetical protein
MHARITTWLSPPFFRTSRRFFFSELFSSLRSVDLLLTRIVPRVLLLPSTKMPLLPTCVVVVEEPRARKRITVTFLGGVTVGAVEAVAACGTVAVAVGDE